MPENQFSHLQDVGLPTMASLASSSDRSNNLGGPMNFGRDRSMLNAAQSNQTDRFELFLLGDGEKKVTEAADTRK